MVANSQAEKRLLLLNVLLCAANLMLAIWSTNVLDGREIIPAQTLMIGSRLDTRGSSARMFVLL